MVDLVVWVRPSIHLHFSITFPTYFISPWSTRSHPGSSFTNSISLLTDFSKLGGGGAGGMPDMGDMGDMGGEGDDDDDEMPGLEDEDGKKAEAEKAGEKEASAQVDAESKGKGKIEEVE